MEKSFDFKSNGIAFRLNIQDQGFTLWKTEEGCKEKWVIDGSCFVEDCAITVATGPDLQSFYFDDRPTTNASDR